MDINDRNIKSTKNWLFLGIISLAVSGLYAILLVSARSPKVQELIPWTDLFKTALTIHVNLSVLVWLISFACVIFSITTKDRYKTIDRIAFILSAIGTLIFTISPFFKSGEALLNNYIPILNNDIFLSGIFLFLLGFSIKTVQILAILLSNIRLLSINSKSIDLTTYTSAIIAFISIICFLLSYIQLSAEGVSSLLDIDHYYELLFWGGGHILQFLYVQIMILCWLLLAKNCDLKVRLSDKIINILLLLNLIIVLPSPLIYVFYDITDFEYEDLFTQQMRYAGGITAIITGTLLLKSFFTKERNPLVNSLKWSIFLFASGGIIAMMISGVNTIIPAHYHGSIVGITLAFMGMTYVILPKLGYGEIKGKMANIQPMLYGGGQFLHIVGFALSGGYGALRKNPVAMESLEGKLSMGLMGAGGGISVIGGLIFIIIVYKSVFTKMESCHINKNQN